MIDTNEEKGLYTAVHNVLTFGMWVSTALFSIGVALAIVHPDRVPSSLEAMPDYYHWSVVTHGLAHGDPNIWMMIGVVLLILTPIGRVVASTIAFVQTGERIWAGMTLLVLAIISLSFVLARTGILH